MTTKFRAAACALAVSTVLGTVPAYADDANASIDFEEKILVVGSRGAPRSIAASPVPVDLVDGEELNRTGSTDMLDMLVGVIPSFNVQANPISDAATLVRPLNLRGLPSDSTLILVNGKRRHRASVIAFQGAGINDGAQGSDISVIPGVALKQVEVLRDGAAAQYGSDAIAGVMNFVLKDSAEGGVLEYKQGKYYEGDGHASTLSGNVGLPLTDHGFANLSFQYKNADATSRSVQRNDAQGLIDGGNTAVAPIAQVWGSPEIKDDITLFGNFGFDLNPNTQLYMFGNYSERDVTGGFYYRNPHTRGGVYSGDGGQTLLIADLDGIGNGIECPTINVTTDNVLTQDDYGLIADNSTDVGKNCFAFNEMLPGGYTPNFGGTVTDSSLTAGVKGEITGGMLDEVFYDVSASVGRNKSTYTIINTVNPSMGPDSPNEFTPGTYIQLEKTFNLDLFKQVEVGLYDPINVMGGLEWRDESFEIQAGDPDSYRIGPFAAQGFNIGSHGFPGFKPEAAGTNSRTSYAAYVDVEAFFTEDFMMGAALRYEDYSTFGDTTNYKLTAQYTVTGSVSVRGSLSSGFRAPTVGQANVSNVQTSFISGELIDSALLPPTSEFSKLFGGTELTPEESENMTLGLVYENSGLFVTADYYNIEVTDRISQSDNYTLTEEDYAALEAIGTSNPRSIGAVSFFTNDFATTTQGVDVVGSYDLQLFGGATKLSLVYNWTDTEVDKFTDITGEFKMKRLEESLPEHRANFTIGQRWEDISAFVRVNYFGEQFLVHADWDEMSADVDPDVTVDLEVNYQLNDNIALSFGAQNLFDVMPEKVSPDADSTLR